MPRTKLALYCLVTVRVCNRLQKKKEAKAVREDEEEDEEEGEVAVAGKEMTVGDETSELQNLF